LFSWLFTRIKSINQCHCSALFRKDVGNPGSSYKN
jgi:hypothetical protein